MDAKDLPLGRLATFLNQIAVFKPDLANLNELMAFSVTTGCLHVLISNGIGVWQRLPGLHRGRSLVALSHVGWIMVIAAVYSIGLTQFLKHPELTPLLLYTIGLGLLMVLLFNHDTPWTLKGF